MTLCFFLTWDTLQALQRGNDDRRGEVLNGSDPLWKSTVSHPGVVQDAWRGSSERRGGDFSPPHIRPAANMLLLLLLLLSSTPAVGWMSSWRRSFSLLRASWRRPQCSVSPAGGRPAAVGSEEGRRVCVPGEPGRVALPRRRLRRRAEPGPVLWGLPEPPAGPGESCTPYEYSLHRSALLQRCHSNVYTFLEAPPLTTKRTRRGPGAWYVSLVELHLSGFVSLCKHVLPLRCCLWSFCVSYCCFIFLCGHFVSVVVSYLFVIVLHDFVLFVFLSFFSVILHVFIVVLLHVVFSSVLIVVFYVFIVVFCLYSCFVSLWLFSIS